MSNLTYSSQELAELAAEALENGDIDGAAALADNATETAQIEAQEQQS